MTGPFGRPDVPDSLGLDHESNALETTPGAEDGYSDRAEPDAVHRGETASAGAGGAHLFPEPVAPVISGSADRGDPVAAEQKWQGSPGAVTSGVAAAVSDHRECGERGAVERQGVRESTFDSAGVHKSCCVADDSGENHAVADHVGSRVTAPASVSPNTALGSGRGKPVVVEQESSRSGVRFATVAVLGIAAVVGGILLVRAGRYGYFGDELYFLAAGNHPSAGYADQGPVIPLIARSATMIAPGSIVVLRIPSILCAVAGVVLSGAIAREMGGRRRAQVLAAVGYATCPYLITQAATLSTFALDTALSAATVWLLVRWGRVRRDRLLAAAAVVIAVDLEVKLLVVVLLAGIVAGVLVAGPRDVLRRPVLWWCAPIVLITVVPQIVWQQRHGWPQLAMGAVIRAEQYAATGGVAGLPLQWAVLTGLLGGLLALLGWWVLLRHNIFRVHRWIGIAALAEVLFVIVSGGRPYYVTGVFPALFAAGAVAVANTGPVSDVLHRLGRITGAAVVVVSAAISSTVIAVLPLPLDRVHHPVYSQAELSTRMRTFGTSGWSRLIAGADAARRALPPGERAGTVILTQTYWQAAALDILGAPHHPPVYSADRGYAYFARPPDTAHTVLYISAGKPKALPRTIFDVAEPIVRLDDRFGFPGIDRGVTIWRCEGPRRPWPVLWPQLTTLVLDPGL